MRLTPDRPPGVLCFGICFHIQWYLHCATIPDAWSGQEMVVPTVHKVGNKSGYLHWATNPGTKNGQQILLPTLGNKT